MKQAALLDLGVRGYEETWALQKQLVEERKAGARPDTLILVEHPEVITLGRRQGSRQNVLAAAAGSPLSPPGAPIVPIVEVERGGDVTYHGPGQLVGYPILLLDEDERDLHAYLRALEEAHIRVAADLGLVARREPGWTGVWVGDRKLVSLGVAVRRWVTMHGFALNVSTALERFGLINPCGLQAEVMTSLAVLLQRNITIAEVQPLVVAHLGDVLGRQFT